MKCGTVSYTYIHTSRLMWVGFMWIHRKLNVQDILYSFKGKT